MNREVRKGVKKMLEELTKRIESLENHVSQIDKEIKEVKELYKLKRLVEFIEVACPVCQKYHKVPNYEGEYDLCKDSNHEWYARVEKDGKVFIRDVKDLWKSLFI